MVIAFVVFFCLSVLECQFSKVGYRYGTETHLGYGVSVLIFLTALEGDVVSIMSGFLLS